MNSASGERPPIANKEMRMRFVMMSILFHVSGIIQYVAFYDWILSLSIMFSGFVHVVAYLNFILFYG